MTLQAISKGFEHFKNVGLKFSLYIFPLIILFGFLASLGSASSFSGDISNADITLLLLNNFLVSPLVTIVAILLANDLMESHYFPYESVPRYADENHDYAISKTQMELIASRVSFNNDCFY